MDEEFSDALSAISEDITGGKTWINSSIPGNITADTFTSPREDFYTWIN